MKVFIALILLTTSTLVAALEKADTLSDEQLIDKGRIAIDAFQSRLKTQLVQAMKTEGPVKAIDVCNQKAQTIAQEVGQLYDLKIKRVSSKARNPLNKADNQDTKILKQFMSELAVNKSLAPEKLVHLDTLRQRYYKAIKIQGLCLTCHGQNIAPDVTDQLRTLYPGDQATGYQVGDLRGTFVVAF